MKQENSFKLVKDNVALITGAASGIGRALAIALDQLGLHLILVDVEQQALQSVSDTLTGEPLIFSIDVANAAAMSQMAETVYDKHANVHLLINNAGVMGPMAPIWELEDSDWEWVLNVNVKGIANGLRAFIPKMLKQPDASHVVNTASEAGFAARAFVGVYHSSKHAVLALTETLAQELNHLKANIGVSVLCPGAVNTQVLKAARNRPESLSKTSAANEIGERLSSIYEHTIAKGMPATDVAQVVIDGLTTGRFYLLPHPEIADLPAARAAAVKQDLHPQFDPNLANFLTNTPAAK
ncbi:MAG: SDR family NAD(P)-dependent oxidoreductase [Pseudomonadales bacterium]|nr:SDR family NAD(P)-dependent oxidoreductase [Pseudomonadales bacterium]